MRPQSFLVEARDLQERVVATSVAVARQVADLREHTEHGGARRGAENALDRLQVCDPLSPEEMCKAAWCVVSS